MNYDLLAQKALDGELLAREEMQAVLDAPDDDLPELLAAAFKVRRKYFGKRVQIHMLMNAKSGLCPEDCHYCSQSSVSHAPIDKYPFLTKEKLIDGALKAKAAGAALLWRRAAPPRAPPTPGKEDQELRGRRAPDQEPRRHQHLLLAGIDG